MQRAGCEAGIVECDVSNVKREMWSVKCGV